MNTCLFFFKTVLLHGPHLLQTSVCVCIKLLKLLTFKLHLVSYLVPIHKFIGKLDIKKIVKSCALIALSYF